MSNRIALTEPQKARLFDRLIANGVIVWRYGKREEAGKMVEKTYIEHGATKDLIVVEEE